MYLNAHRRAELRDTVERVLASFERAAHAALVAAGSTRADEYAHAMVAVIDGHLIHAIARPGTPNDGSMRRALRAIVTAALMDADEVASWDVRLDTPPPSRLAAEEASATTASTRTARAAQATGRRATAEKAAAKRTAVEKATAEKATAEKAGAKKAGAKKAGAEKAAAKKTTTERTPAKKATTERAGTKGAGGTRTG
jgi:hypothetical protein